MIAYSVIPLAVLLGVVGSLVTRGRPIIVKLVAGLAVFSTITLALTAIVGSPMSPAISGSAMVEPVQRLFVAIWWLYAARLVVLAGMLVFGIRRHHHEAKLASDLVAGVIYVGTILFVLDRVFDIAVTGLVATSGIIAIVLGLALQNTLGDLFSGIAIGLERPFRVGDRLWIEGAIEGSVVETNWRATRIMTDTNDVATVPNSVVARARLLNRSRPTEVRTDTVHVALDPDVAPTQAIALLEAAVATTPGLAAEPAASVYCSELHGEGTRYAITFSAPRRELLGARSRLLESVSRHAFFAGVSFAMQTSLPLRPRHKPSALEVLAQIDLLADCLEEERAVLAANLVVRRGTAGEVLVAQSEVRTSLFLVVTGVFDVSHQHEGAAVRLGTAGPGDHIGEMSLLAGEQSFVTIKATTPFMVYELTKEALAPHLGGNPRLLQAFETGASRVRAKIDRFHTGQDRRSHSVNLISRIRAFFDMPH